MPRSVIDALQRLGERRFVEPDDVGPQERAAVRAARRRGWIVPSGRPSVNDAPFANIAPARLLAEPTSARLNACMQAVPFYVARQERRRTALDVDLAWWPDWATARSISRRDIPVPDELRVPLERGRRREPSGP
jgi:hypothetical protein